jgi:phosphate starvation-inducible PhoH-like protein
MGINRANKPKEKMKDSFLLAPPFAWNKTQAEIIGKMTDHSTSCVIVDSLAGTGKTIMSTFSALQMLQHGKCKKIYYVRSAVESASSKLQALPGSWEEKIAVYGGPLLDALGKLVAPHEVESFIRTKTIEVIPTSYLRGRSLDNAVVIVDEAQNFVLNELITIMTRLEEHTKLYIIADSDQCDLAKPFQQEFFKLVNLFKDNESIRQGIHFYEMRDPELVMRSKFVKYVSKKYSDYKKLINS